jgi:spore maturation protein CgeB
MRPGRLRIVVIGLSITSSWGNGHATTYRALLRALAARGHDVLFLERDVPWYAENRDLPEPPYGRTVLYGSLEDLQRRCAIDVRHADCVIVGSYVPDGVAVGEWVLHTARGVRAFYDIDTPVTLAALEQGDSSYITRSLLQRYDLYLSFTGGPILDRLERVYGSPLARPLYCSFDPVAYYPTRTPVRWAIGYMGTYSDDRQPALDTLLLEVARRSPRERFAVAGPAYPDGIAWPANVDRLEHVPPSAHRGFYTAQRYTLNVTRAEMVKVGHSPSVRLFEAAACGTPIVSDWWDGLDAFFEPSREILVATCTEDVVRIVHDLSESGRCAIGARARARVLRAHTPRHRVEELERYIADARRVRAEVRAS